MSAPTGEKPNLNITVGMPLTDESPFLGTVVIDTVEEGTYGYQWHLAVKPCEFELHGKAGTGAFHTYYGVSQAKKSKIGAALEALEGVVKKGTRVGQDELLGLTCWWVRKDLPFGTDKETGEPMVAKQVLIPLRKATEEEQERAAKGPVSAEVEAPTALDEDQLEAVLAVLRGKSPKDAQIAGAKSKLPPELKQFIMDGTAYDHLIENDVIVLDDDGKIVDKEPF